MLDVDQARLVDGNAVRFAPHHVRGQLAPTVNRLELPRSAAQHGQFAAAFVGGMQDRGRYGRGQRGAVALVGFRAGLECDMRGSRVGWRMGWFFAWTRS